MGLVCLEAHRCGKVFGQSLKPSIESIVIFLYREFGFSSHVVSFFFERSRSELKNTQRDFKRFNFECRKENVFMILLLFLSCFSGNKIGSQMSRIGSRKIKETQKMTLKYKNKYFAIQKNIKFMPNVGVAGQILHCRH